MSFFIPSFYIPIRYTNIFLVTDTCNKARDHCTGQRVLVQGCTLNYCFSFSTAC